MCHWSTRYALRKVAVLLRLGQSAGRDFLVRVKRNKPMQWQSVFLGIAILFHSAWAAAESRPLPFNIPSQQADAALLLFGKQADISVVYQHRLVKTYQTNQLKGEFTPQEGIRILLRGSGLKAEFKSRAHLVITQNNQGNEMNSKKKILAATVGFFMGAGGVSHTSAEEMQSAEEMDWLLEEVVVTATKREQKLIDVPISISVLGNEAIKERRIQDITDLSYVVPNLTITKQAGGVQRISLRGIGNFEGSSALVGIYLDETPLSLHPYIQAGMQAIDLERVEVLKGPQGTLYGQGSSGGTIRFITNNPSFEGYYGEIGVSAYATENGGDSQEFTAIANLPLVADTFALRVAATYKDIGGWIDHPDVNRDDANDTELSNVRIKGLWQVSDNFSVQMTASHSKDDAGAQSETNLGPATDSTYRTVARNGLDPASTEVSHEAEIYNLTLNYDLGFATVTSSTSDIRIFNNTDSLSYNILQDVDLNEGWINLDDANELEGFSQELRLSNADTDRLDWTVGLYYTDTDSHHSIAGIGIYSDGVGGEIFSNFAETETSETTAFFGNISYAFSDELTLSIGTRYFEDERTFQVPLFGQFENKTFDNLSSRVSLAYAFDEETNVYFSVAEGFRSGGFNFFSSSTYEPETVTTYELGVKARAINGRVTIEGALYHSEYTDYQSATLDGGVTNILNPGEAEIQGFEFSTVASITEGFSVGLSGNYTDTEFTKVSLDVPIYVNGDAIPNIPQYSYSVDTRFDFNWSSDVSGSAFLEYNRQSGAYAINRLSYPNYKSSPIGQLNAQVSANWTSFNASLFARNLTNDLRGTRASPPGQLLDAQNRPRTFGVEVSYIF